MTLPNTRNTSYTPGAEVKSVDLNDLQDGIVRLDYVRALLGDVALASRALGDQDPRPTPYFLFAAGTGGVPYPHESTARTLRSGVGAIFQALSGTIDGVTPQFLGYQLDVDELAVTFGDNSSGFGRWDLVQVKLAPSGTLPQRVELIFNVKVGIPAADPAEPSPDTGYVRWAAVLIPDGIGSGLLDAANIRDHRMPLGFQNVDVMAKDAIYDPDKWTPEMLLFGSWGRICVEAAAYPISFVPTVPGADRARILGIFFSAGWTSGGAARKVELVRFNFNEAGAYTPAGTLVADLTADLLPAAGIGYPLTHKSWFAVADPSKPPLWLNGHPSGYANAIASTGTVADRLVLRYMSGGASLTDVVNFVRFWIAG